MWHLQQVCRDECEDLVNAASRERDAIPTHGAFQRGVPAFVGCAEKVVKQVEANLLGCCGRTCGWNDQSCMSWPFMNQTEKVNWLEECCTEYSEGLALGAGPGF